jgi:hypothetical protein
MHTYTHVITHTRTQVMHVVGNKEFPPLKMQRVYLRSTMIDYKIGATFTNWKGLVVFIL